MPFHPIASLRLKLLETFKVSADQKPRFELLKALGEALLEFKNTPAQTGNIKGKIVLPSNGAYPTNAAPVNLGYFKLAGRIFCLAEELGYKEEIAKRCFPGTFSSYPQAFEKMKTGTIKGIEAPLWFAEGVCKQIAISFFNENKNLSAIYKGRVKKESFSSGRAFMGNIMGQNVLDQILTQMAKEDPEYIGPAGERMKLMGRIHPDSPMNLSI